MQTATIDPKWATVPSAVLIEPRLLSEYCAAIIDKDVEAAGIPLGYVGALTREQIAYWRTRCTAMCRRFKVEFRVRQMSLEKYPDGIVWAIVKTADTWREGGKPDPARIGDKLSFILPEQRSAMKRRR